MLTLRPFKPSSTSLTSLLAVAALAAAALGAACVETEEAPPPPKGFNPDPNATYIVVGVQSGKCIEVTQPEPRGMQIRNCQTSPFRSFKFQPAGAGFYRIHNTESNLCVDIEAQSKNDAARLVGRPCADVPSQQWSLPEAAPGVVKFTNRLSGKSMDVFGTNTADGTNLIQWPPHDQPNQRFKLQPSPGPAPAPETPKPPKPVAIGFATVDGSLTGGGDGPATVVTSLADLNTALTGPAPRVVRMSGTISGAVTVGPNKTLEGAPDAVLKGRVAMAPGASNIILRNLKVVAEPCGKRPGCTPDTDAAVSIGGRANHVWIDHNDLSNGAAANLIVTDSADNITVSWSKLSSTGTAKGKRMGGLIGMGKADKKAEGHLRVTFHHNWWAGDLDGAMPRARFAQVHVFNDYFDSAKSRTAVEAADDAKVVLENSSFKGITKPQSLLAPSAQLVARGNVYDPAPKSPPEMRGTAFVPPYPFKMDAAMAIPALVKAEAGPRPEAPAAAKK
jgi:pectate lyase